MIGVEWIIKWTPPGSGAQYSQNGVDKNIVTAHSEPPLLSHAFSDPILKYTKTTNQ